MSVQTLESLTGEYKLDVAHTRIGFAARHAMVTKVRGQFNEFEGSAQLDFADPRKSTAELTIQTQSVDTRNDQRDAHLRTIDFDFTGTAVDPFGNIRVGFEGSTTINRRDWKVEWNAPLETGGVLVSDK